MPELRDAGVRLPARPDTGGKVALTEDALARVGAIRAALAALEASHADMLTIRAAADALVGHLRELIVTGIRPAPATELGNGTSEPEAGGPHGAGALEHARTDPRRRARTGAVSPAAGRHRHAGADRDAVARAHRDRVAAAHGDRVARAHRHAVAP